MLLMAQLPIHDTGKQGLFSLKIRQRAYRDINRATSNEIEIYRICCHSTNGKHLHTYRDMNKATCNLEGRVTKMANPSYTYTNVLL
jgi:hypothetical protein